MEKEVIICKNCEKSYEKGFQFCPHCGQKTDDELTLGVLFYNTISNYFSFDARFFKSYIPLMFKPGYLAKKFIEGKRLLYLHPAQMYLFISVVFFFLFSFITRETTEQFDKALKKDFDKTETVIDSLKNGKLLDSLKTEQFLKPISENKIPIEIVKNNKDLDSILNNKDKKEVVNTSFGFDTKKIDSLIEINATDSEIHKVMGLDDNAGTFKKKFYSQMLKFYKQRNGGSILQAFYDTIPIAMFILLPIFALLLKLFYYRKGSFSYHLVFTFYFFSFLFMVFSILILADLVTTLPGYLISLVMFSTYFYLLLAVKNFYKQGYFLSLIKSGVISFLFLIFVIPLAVIIMGISAFLFY
ncbi:DUF3667 domain-containing protein [Gaetbulibacter sp. M235]|uniref:DUF3667 domain-containing protein n=1 Tax=Gaetbulibacter sp. M235 TaxID=3126510 RepID=UPI00374FA6E3